MPNFISPLLPTFGLDEEFKKGLKKAEQYLIGYGVGITIARKIPATAKPLGFILGLNIVPGKGISIKPIALPLLYAPQPIGVMPPEYYHLPNTIADPLKLAKIALKKNRGEELQKAFDQDYIEQEERAEKKRVFGRATISEYTQRFAVDLAAGRVPAPPTIADAFGVSIGPDGIPSISRPDPLGLDQPGGVGPLFSEVNSLLDQLGAAGLVPGRAGSIPVIEPEQPQGDTAAIVGQIQRLDEFGRLNPPDP